MRLNTKEYQKIMESKGLMLEDVCKSTGLSMYSLKWILDNGGSASINALQSLAIAAGVELKEVVRAEASDNQENGIEFLRGAKEATVQFTNGSRLKTRVKKLAESHPDKCKVLVENTDGTLLAHIPVTWIKIGPPKKVSESQREAGSRNFKKARSI